jgi:hypothetical protein
VALIPKEVWQSPGATDTVTRRGRSANGGATRRGFSGAGTERGSAMEHPAASSAMAA